MRIPVDHARVAETFAKFSNNASLQESAQLFARGLPIAEMIQAFAMSPNVLRAFAGFEHVYPNGLLERGVLEKVILRVSELHECQFCIHSHLEIMRGLGIGTDTSPGGGATERASVAIEYAEQMTRDSNRIDDSFFRKLHLVFTDPEIIELTFHIGFITMLNRFNNALRVRYRDEFKGMKIQ